MVASEIEKREDEAEQARGRSKYHQRRLLVYHKHQDDGFNNGKFSTSFKTITPALDLDNGNEYEFRAEGDTLYNRSLVDFEADTWMIDFSEKRQGDVQEASAPAIRVRSANEHHPLLEKINSMLASSASLAKSVRATHVERSNTDPSTMIARTNVLGNNTALSIHTNGSHTSAVFAEVSPVNRPALMPTDYDYFTFGGVDGIKMTAQVVNGTLAQSAYVADLVHLTQDFVESTTDGFSNSDSWTYQFCNRTTFSPLFYGRIIAEQTVPEQRLGYEDAIPFNCSTTTV
ncbi:hypothetical protein LTR29_017662 [Friedmanniomyces endolithicus]|nr:hypothetical protein LTR29_017662 [Friedmanniomyces endolithicus]